MAKKIGFVVGNANLSDKEDGFIIVNSDEKELLGLNANKIIAVNSKREFCLKRFIIAHELGHYLLREDNQKIFAHRENKIGKNEEENEFDYFAACLLMPKEKFEEKTSILMNKGIKDDELIYELSNSFQVPSESVRRRFDELELTFN